MACLFYLFLIFWWYSPVKLRVSNYILGMYYLQIILYRHIKLLIYMPFLLTTPQAQDGSQVPSLKSNRQRGFIRPITVVSNVTFTKVPLHLTQIYWFSFEVAEIAKTKIYQLEILINKLKYNWNRCTKYILVIQLLFRAMALFRDVLVTYLEVPKWYVFFRLSLVMPWRTEEACLCN